MKFFSMAVLLVMVPSLLCAQSREVSLRDAIALSLDHNPLVKAASHRESAAQKGVAASRSRFLPRIFLDETFTAANTPTHVFMMKMDQGRFASDDLQIARLNNPAATTDFRTAFALDQPLFDLDLIAGVQLAAADAQKLNYALLRTREEIAFSVFTAYLEVQKASSLLAATDQAVLAAREQLRAARAKEAAGMGLKSDELRAVTFLAEMEQQHIRAGNSVELACLRLALAAGAPEGESYSISAPVAERPVSYGLEELLAVAKARRTDLQETAQAVAAARIDSRRAGYAFLPTLHGNATYQMHDRDRPFGWDDGSWAVGIHLRWELFDGLRRIDERGRTHSLERAAQESLQHQEREIGFQVRESMLNLVEAKQRLAVSRTSLQAAEEAVRLVSKRFANDLATLADLFDAQVALNRARYALADNEAAVILATGQVWYRAGIFLQEVMQ